MYMYMYMLPQNWIYQQLLHLSEPLHPSLPPLLLEFVNAILLPTTSAHGRGYTPGNSCSLSLSLLSLRLPLTHSFPSSSSTLFNIQVLGRFRVHLPLATPLSQPRRCCRCIAMTMGTPPTPMAPPPHPSPLTPPPHHS